MGIHIDSTKTINSDRYAVCIRYMPIRPHPQYPFYNQCPVQYAREGLSLVFIQ